MARKHKCGVPNLKVAEIKKMIPESCGSVNWLAKHFKCSWSTMNVFIQNSTILTQMLLEIQGRLLEKAKDNIINGIHDGDLQTSRWYVAKKDAEYRDKLELSGDMDININITGVDDEELEKL